MFSGTLEEIMKRQTIVLFALILLTILSCKNERQFSEGRRLTAYKNTDFIPTLEHKIGPDKNSVYCVTLLYAWDQIRKKINQPFEVSKEQYDLTLFNDSKSYIDVLNPDEYSVSGEVDGDLISARAEFNKSLPFEVRPKDWGRKLVFDGFPVASFGISGYDDYEQLQSVKIVYYENDNNFIIKLLPRDKQHEIILFKTEQTFSSIADMVLKIEMLTTIEKKERTDDNHSWKYEYANEDEVVIPKINFNIETNYSTLEETQFRTKDQHYQIARAWQRIAFILDETGAEIESEAEMEAATEAIDEDYQKPKPKKMFFDTPFLTLLKRTDAKNPYFGLWTTNTDLMTKE
ncbi:MAG: hypothetical protein COA58_15780 [Bacteroidetes bacterium]|nr:MAG: hypothetical protein COA58_15780 [Bacteroidota bacterium]